MLCAIAVLVPLCYGELEEVRDKRVPFWPCLSGALPYIHVVTAFDARYRFRRHE